MGRQTEAADAENEAGQEADWTGLDVYSAPAADKDNEEKEEAATSKLPVGSIVSELDCMGAFIRHERGSATAQHSTVLHYSPTHDIASHW